MFTKYGIESLELNDMNELISEYDFKRNKNLLISIEASFDGETIDLVVYNTEDMLEQPYNNDIDEFYLIVNENCLEKEDFEVNRITLNRI